MEHKLHYQDHHDKMSYLCSMENKEVKTSPYKLLPLFLQQGVTQILQSYSGRVFLAKVVPELMTLQIVHGFPPHP